MNLTGKIALFALMGVGVACGSGDGTSAQIACGAGTVLQGGQCVPITVTPPPLPLKGVSLTYAAVDYDLTKSLFVGNPLPVELGVTAVANAGAPAVIPMNLTVSLVEKPAANATDTDLANLATCMVGGQEINLRTDGSEQRFHPSFTIPTECAPQGTKTYNLMVSFDALEIDQSGVSKTVVLTEREKASPDNQACQSGEPLAPGCVQDLSVGPSPGLDLELHALSADSSVALLFTGTPDPNEENSPSLTVHTGLNVFGRDGYTHEAPADDTLPGAVDVVYSIAPASGSESSNWQPLMVGAPGAHAAKATYTQIPSGTEFVATHDLYIEGQAATNLTTTWTGIANLNVRACVSTAAFKEAGNLGGTPLNGIADPGDNTGNNCQIIPVTLVQSPTSGAGASTLSFERSWTKSAGNSKFALNLNFGTSNVLDGSGARTNTSGDLYLSGLLASHFSLLRAWAKAGAMRQIANSYVDVGVDLFGINLYGYKKTLGNTITIDYTKNFSVSKQYCFPAFRYGVLVATVSVEACASGEVGLETKLHIQATNGPGAVPFDTAKISGVVSGTAKPYATLGATVIASLDATIARVGVEGILTIVDLSAPATIALDWGVVTNEGVDVMAVQPSAKWSMDLALLNATINLFADLRTIKLCKKWGIKYPCGLTWTRKATLPLWSYSGPKHSWPLLNRTGELTYLF